MSIHLLSQNLINQIAAGEVIERPASIIKELVENSIDAGASEVIVKFQNAGITKIQIIDNGKGIDESEIELAFMRNATSKILNVEDLMNIHTLGFRGEALASISSIAKVEIETRTENNVIAVHCDIDNGKIIDKKYVQRQVGTTLTISDIFYNIPARRKFLKSEVSEKSHIIDTFVDIATANPNIKLSLYNEEKVLYSLPISDQLNRIINLYKLEKENYFKLNLDEESDKYKQDIQISGIFSHPKICDNKRTLEEIFVNGRSINDNSIKKAVSQSYQGYIPHFTYPKFIIFININPNIVDVNVHPRKLEVRFDEPSNIFKAVYRQIHSLVELNLQKEVKLKFENFQRFKDNDIGISSEIKTDVINNYTSQSILDRNILDNNIENYLKSSKSPKTSNAAHNTDMTNDKGFVNNINIQNTPNISINLNTDKLQTFFDVDKSKNDNTSIEQKTTNYGRLDFIKSMQVFETYLIIEYIDRLQIIDQHAADERISYDKLLLSINEKSYEYSNLLIPIELDLNNSQKEKLEIFLKELLKFHIEIIKKNDVYILEKLPIILQKVNWQNFITNILDTIEIDILDMNDVDIEFAKKIARIACHSSIRAGKYMSEPEIRKMILDLYTTQNPYSCPHGRPIIWELKKYDIEKKFGRII